jgi:MFS transporter, DHA1 family, multidrug resistance protein
VRNAIPMGVTMMATSVLSILAVWILVRPRSVPRLSDPS